MNLDVTFEESKQSFAPQFGEVHNITDGGYEKGYDEGKEAGYTEGETVGYEKGFTEGEAKGYITGFSEGNANGYSQGYMEGQIRGEQEGYLRGHEEGYNSGYNMGQQIGKEEGKSEAYDEIQTLNDELEQTLYGTDTGGKSFYDEFWDVFQQNGNLNNYTYAFAGAGWTAETLKPKYLVKPLETQNNNQFASGLFWRCSSASSVIDFETIADKFNFSELRSARNLFDSSNITNVSVDLSNCEVANYAFASQWGWGVDKLTLKVTEKMTQCNGMFEYNQRITEITLTGGSVIACNGWNVKWATRLSHDSITSIINALSTTTSGLTVTVSKTAVNKAFETSEGADDGSTSEEWLNLIASRSNWTINLIDA